MDRTELLRQMGEARTPNEITTSLAAGRAWLRRHPVDHDVSFAMLELLCVERSAVRVA